MKRLLAFALALLCTAALAHNKPPAPNPNASASANASANASAVGAPSSSSADGGDYSLIALPGAGSAAPLPAGMCLVGESSNVGGLSFFSAKSRTWIDMQCLQMLVELERLKATPVPRPAVEILTEATPRREFSRTGLDATDPTDNYPRFKRAQERAQYEAAQGKACAPPAKAKTVADAKKAGACKL